MEIGALIVDDDEDIRLLIRMIIEDANEGLFVKGEAADGAEALDRVEDSNPAVVIIDEMMPGMNGVEAAELIRRRRPGQLMILCSAYLDDDLRTRAEQVGIKVCLTKAQVNEIPAALHAVTRLEA